MTKRTFDYRDKVIVVTGGAGGIGTAFCALAAGAGARVMVVDRRAEPAAELVASLPGSGHRAFAVDLTQRAEVDGLITDLEQSQGRIDVLVNNLGMTSCERFDERSVESIERELLVNLHAPLILTRLAIPLLRCAADPRVVTTVSLGGIFPLGETPIYTASKFGLRGAMLSIGLDLAAKGIKAGSVLPSATDTAMLAQEAVEGGNALQFQDAPQTPAQVAAAMDRLLAKPRLEVYPRPSESWLVRVALLAPNLLPRIMPLFRGRGDRGQARYLAQLQAQGRVVKVDGQWAIAPTTGSDV